MIVTKSFATVFIILSYETRLDIEYGFVFSTDKSDMLEV